MATTNKYPKRSDLIIVTDKTDLIDTAGTIYLQGSLRLDTTDSQDRLDKTVFSPCREGRIKPGDPRAETPSSLRCAEYTMLGHHVTHFALQNIQCSVIMVIVIQLEGNLLH